MKTFKEAGFRKADIETLGADFDVFKKIGSEWMLVTAGKEDSYNTMTASWGFAGIMWNKACVITAIRPQRYTKEYIDKNEYFTLSFYPEEYRKALAYCGANSGRDVDKAAETGLVPVKGDSCVAFEQAKIILVCKKLFAQDMNADCFIDKNIISQQYLSNDFHTAYYGEIVDIYVK